MPWNKIQRAVERFKTGSLRSALDQLWGSLSLEGLSANTPPISRVAFTIAVVTLAAKMSKADGVSTKLEAEAFERLFKVPARELDHVRRVFQIGSQDLAGYEAYAEQIAGLLAAEPELRRTVLECLFHIASADGILHPGEDRFLGEVARIFGFSQAEYRCVRRAFIVDPDSPYEVLGLPPDASLQELKAHYRDLAKTHHPDVLVSKGVPVEFLTAAQRRLAAVNAAYEAILSERGLKTERALEPAP